MKIAGCGQKKTVFPFNANNIEIREDEGEIITAYEACPISL